MLYDENQLKKASELLKEIHQFKTKKLGEVRSILFTLNGNNNEYLTQYDKSIFFDGLFSMDKAKDIIADMEAKNKSRENSETNERIREEHLKKIKYGPGHEYPPKN
ncbi:MAG: hypothetical protein IJK39_02810 [Bacteroidales bacterium]|nr:hypothetical protein [Bacteroidales bacterium]